MQCTILKLIVLVLTSTFLFAAYADIAFSGSSVNSLVISNQRSEDEKAYYLTVNIEGIDSSEVKFQVKGQRLYMSAQQGGVVSGNAVAGAQLINYSYSFADNADMQKLSRANLKNKVVITIPKY